MKFINYIVGFSTVLAFKDYFKDVQDLKYHLEKNKHYTEDWEPKKIETITNGDGFQVLSVAVHGGTIENSTDTIGKILYQELRKKQIKSKAALYTFNAIIDKDKSGYINQTNKCITAQCCESIEGLKKPTEYANLKKCKDNYKKIPQERECSKDEVCYLNAVHITSENFMTKELRNLLTHRYPVSFHGFLNRDAEDKKPVDIVLGGLSNQKHELAKKLYTRFKHRAAVCLSGKNCRVYEPRKNWNARIKFNGTSLTGTSKDNFVNLGKQRCGLQLELSNTYRNLKNDDITDWKILVEEIINTLSKDGNGVCIQPKD